MKMDTKEMIGTTETILLEWGDAKMRILYDSATGTAINGAAGVKAHISRKKMDDFLAVARELGFKLLRL